MMNETFFGDFQTLWRGPNCLFSKSFDYARDFRDFLVWLLEYTTDVSSCFKAEKALFGWFLFQWWRRETKILLGFAPQQKSCWHSTTQIVKNYLSFMPSAKNEKLIKLTFLYLALKSNISYLFSTWKKFSSQRVQWIWSGVTIQVPHTTKHEFLYKYSSPIFRLTHSVWKSPKMSHLNFWTLAFSTNFCLLKMTCLEALLDR